MPHAIVIGAGPAGSTAALLLARAGWRVTVVEQNRFPRDKVCGECLSALGYDVLDRLGLTAPFAALNPVRFTRTALHAPGGSSISLPLPRPMWGVSRSRFDAFLLDAAREAGANVVQPARCETLSSHDHDHVVARVRHLDSNTVRDYPADVALVADGKAALLPRRPMPTGDFGIKAHFEHVDGPRDAIELFGVRGTYGGLAAVEQGRWNAAFSAPRSRLRDCRGDVDGLFAQFLDENRTLRARLRGARRVTEWIAAPLPRFAVTRSWPPRVLPIGNAAAALEPIGGEGMGLAMRSAELATGELIRHGGAPDGHELRRRFDRLWRRRRVTCRAAALGVSIPRLSDLALRRGALSRPLAHAAFRLLGKTM